MEGRIARKRIIQRIIHAWRCLLLYLHTRTRLYVAHERVAARARQWRLSASIGAWGYEAQVSRHHTRLLARHLVKTVAQRLKVLACLCWNSRLHLLRKAQRLASRLSRRRLAVALRHLRSVACHSRYMANNVCRVSSRCVVCAQPDPTASAVE